MGASDVDRIETAIRELRAVDHQYGGGRCYDAILAQLPVAHALLAAGGTEAVSGRLSTAVADLHNLAGWVCFDIGLADAAYAHFQQALQFAGWSDNNELVANVRYRIGRVHLHYEEAETALLEFRAGQVAATACGSRHAQALLYANQAWAYAKLGRSHDSLTKFGHAVDAFDRKDAERAPDWATFFDETDLTAMAGTVHTQLALTVDPRHTRAALPALSSAAASYGPDMARSRAFTLIALATAHLLDGDVDEGARAGSLAVDLCVDLASIRTIDRMHPLWQQATKRSGHHEADELRMRIAALSAA